MYLDEEGGVVIMDPLNGFGLPMKEGHSIVVDDEVLEALAEVLRITPVKSPKLDLLTSKINMRRAARR
jgi:hypothetical protein